MYFRQPNPANKYGIMVKLSFRRTTVFCHYAVLFWILGLDKVICIPISKCNKRISVPCFGGIREFTVISAEERGEGRQSRLSMLTSITLFDSVKILFPATLDSSAIITERGKLRNGLFLMAQTGKKLGKKPPFFLSREWGHVLRQYQIRFVINL